MTKKIMYIGYYDISNSSISVLNIIKNELQNEKLEKKTEKLKQDQLEYEKIIFKNFEFILFNKKIKDEFVAETINEFLQKELDDENVEIKIFSSLLKTKNNKSKDVFLNTITLFLKLKEIKYSILKIFGFKNEQKINELIELFKQQSEEDLKFLNLNQESIQKFKIEKDEEEKKENFIIYN
eukprot:gene5041-8637_t